MLPWLVFLLVSPLVVRQGCGEHLQVCLGTAQGLTGQAHGNEVDKGGLSTTRISQKNQAMMAVELL
jgi:hypothetical protein